MAEHSDDTSTIKLEDLLNDLAELIENREKCLEGLKSQCEKDYSDNIMSILSQSANGQQDIDSFHQDCLTTGAILKSEIEDNVEKQKDILKNIMLENEIFCRSREIDPLATERNKVIQKIEQAVAKYAQLQSQFSAGITFYSNLQV